MSETLVPSRKRKLTTRRPCGNQTKASQLETQQSSRTNAAQLRAKNVRPRDQLDKRATLASTKNMTTTTATSKVVARKPMIAVENHKDNSKAHQRNWKVAPVRPSKPPVKKTVASQRPVEVGKQKQKPAAVKTTTTTTTIYIKHKVKQQSAVEEEVDDATVTIIPQQETRRNTELVKKPTTPKCRDPQMCGEYVEEIFSYLLTREKLPCFIINEGFLDCQTQVRINHRRVLVDWLVQVQERYALLPETLYTCIDLLDRYLQAVPVSKARLQLVGVTSLFIAAKYEEIYPPMCLEMAYITADTFTTEDIRNMEKEILHTLDYLVNKPLSLTFLRRYSKVKNATMYMHNLAKYILELSFMYVSTRCFLPSLKAAAALLIADSLLSLNPKITFNEHRSAELVRVKKELFTAFKEGHINKRFRTIRRKFSSSQYNKVSELEQLEKYS